MMTLSGLFSSWATPETSWPSADILAACTSWAWVSRSRMRLSCAVAYRRAFSSASAAWSANACSACSSSAVNSRPVWSPRRGRR